MAHAAAWLAQAYKGTDDESTYRSEAESYLSDGYIWALDWSDKRALVNVSQFQHVLLNVRLNRQET